MLRTPEAGLAEDDLQHLFISHLNRIYAAKKQLVDRLPELADHAHFLDLKQAIEETIEVVQNQIMRMDQIFAMLQTAFFFEAAPGLISYLDEAFETIRLGGTNPETRDLSILFYMQVIESIEIASFKAVMLIAEKLHNAEINQLLKESYDEAKDDRVLFLAIMSKYVNGV